MHFQIISFPEQESWYTGHKPLWDPNTGWDQDIHSKYSVPIPRDVQQRT